MGDGDLAVTTSWEGDVFKVVISGKVTSQTAFDIAGAVFEVLNAEKPELVLYDCRATDGRLSLGETYLFVRMYPTQRYRPRRSAVLENPRYRDYGSFHETTATNAGSHLRVFTEPEEALRWLTSPDADR